MTMFSKKNAVRAALSFITTVTLLLSAQSTIAADEIVLAQTSGCLACHRGLEQRIGPPFKKVAEKYAGQKDAKTMSLLVDHVINGTGPNGVGWMKDGLATLPFMPPNSNVTPKDANKLLRWVLATTGEIANPTEFVTESVAISGAVEHPLKLSVDDLRKFPPKKVGGQVLGNDDRYDAAQRIFGAEPLGHSGEGCRRFTQPQRCQENGHHCHCQRWLQGRVLVDRGIQFAHG